MNSQRTLARTTAIQVVPGNAVVPEADQHSPTLLGGSTPGAQGVVRLWAPSPTRLWLRSLAWSVPGVTLVFLFFNHLHLPLLPLVVLCVLFAAVCLTGAEIALRWPRRLAADDAGVAIATWGGGHTLRWTEVTAIERRCTALCQPYLAVHTPGETYVVELAGYPKRAQQDILATMITSSRLTPDPVSALTWVRAMELAGD